MRLARPDPARPYLSWAELDRNGRRRIVVDSYSYRHCCCFNNVTYQRGWNVLSRCRCLVWIQNVEKGLCSDMSRRHHHHHWIERLIYRVRGRLTCTGELRRSQASDLPLRNPLPRLSLTFQTLERFQTKFWKPNLMEDVVFGRVTSKSRHPHLFQMISPPLKMKHEPPFQPSEVKRVPPLTIQTQLCRPYAGRRLEMLR